MPSSRGLPARLPLWWLLAVAAAAVALLPAAGTLADLDVYWRVRAGAETLRTGSVATTELWNFPTLGRDSPPTAWLADVTLALAHRIGGWHGVVAWRLLAAIALLVLAARLVLPRARPLAGGLAYAVTAVALSPFLQERPQLLSLVVLAALLPRVGPWRPDVPHPLALAALGWLWAGLHGLWVLLPGLLLLRAAVALADEGRAGLALARRAALGALAAVAAAAVTPAGPALVLQPLVLGRAARDLREWQPVGLTDVETWPFLLLAGAVVVAWARRGERVARGELLWVGAAVAFGLVAGRNLPAATLLVAPLAATRLDALLPDRRTTAPRGAFLGVAAAGALLLGALAATTPPIPADAPVRLVRLLNAEPGEVRVLNAYNTGGLLTGHAEPHVRAAIDGRLGAYPDGFLHRYLRAMRLQGDWSALVGELRPTHALLERSAPLTYVLEDVRGWRRTAEHGAYVLLAAP